MLLRGQLVPGRVDRVEGDQPLQQSHRAGGELSGGHPTGRSRGVEPCVTHEQSALSSARPASLDQRPPR